MKEKNIIMIEYDRNEIDKISLIEYCNHIKVAMGDDTRIVAVPKCISLKQTNREELMEIKKNLEYLIQELDKNENV